MAKSSTRQRTVQNNSRRKAPPYARRTAHHHGNFAHVFVGLDAWDLAEAREAAGVRCLLAVMPEDTDPASLDWGAFRGREVKVSIYGDAHAQAHAVAVQLVQAGAVFALTIDHHGAAPMNIYRARPQGGAHA